MDPETFGGRRNALAFYAAAYGALLVAVALAAVIGGVWHSGLLNMYVRLQLNRWGFSAYGLTVTLVLVLVWLSLAIVLEHRFSHARDLAALGRGAGRVLAAEALLLGASYLLFRWLVPLPIY